MASNFESRLRGGRHRHIDDLGLVDHLGLIDDLGLGHNLCLADNLRDNRWRGRRAGG